MVRLLVERVDQSGQETSFAFRRCAITALTTPQPRIEQVPEGISEHVEGVDDNRQAKPRPERQPGGLLHVPAPFPAEHASPVRNAGWQTVSEEAQRSQRHNHPPDVNGEDNDDGCHKIGQHMVVEDFARGGAHGPSCQKIVILLNADHGASGYS